MSNLNKVYTKINLLSEKIKELSDKGFTSDQRKCIYMNDALCCFLSEIRGLGFVLTVEDNPVVGIEFSIVKGKPKLNPKVEWKKYKEFPLEYKKFLEVLAGGL
jgi:hypothetical protein